LAEAAGWFNLHHKKTFNERSFSGNIARRNVIWQVGPNNYVCSLVGKHKPIKRNNIRINEIWASRVEVSTITTSRESPKNNALRFAPILIMHTAGTIEIINATIITLRMTVRYSISAVAAYDKLYHEKGTNTLKRSMVFRKVL